MAAMRGEHACAAEGCAKMVAAERLMCLAHWKGLPVEIQREVNATWRRFRYDRPAYEEAREKAVAHWRGRSPVAPRQGSLL